jgi:DNA-binding NarL/FixJ family response regulator
MIRILLADDHTVLREALRAVLDREEDMQVVAEAGDCDNVLRLARECSPDVVVMDISMPGVNGIETTRRLLAESPAIKVLALSTHSERNIVQQMLDAGAAGYVVKSAAAAELRKGIRAVVEGRSYLCAETTALLVDSLRGRRSRTSREPQREALTRRERQVLSLLAEGRTSPEMADCLHISPSTVEVHRRNIMRKLELRNVAELTKYAIREGLTSG